MLTKENTRLLAAATGLRVTPCAQSGVAPFTVHGDVRYSPEYGMYLVGGSTYDAEITQVLYLQAKEAV